MMVFKSKSTRAEGYGCLNVTSRVVKDSTALFNIPNTKKGAKNQLSPLYLLIYIPYFVAFLITFLIAEALNLNAY